MMRRAMLLTSAVIVGCGGWGVVSGEPARHDAPAATAAEADRATVRPAATDWPWWCGPGRDNIAAPNQDPPVHWSKTKGIIWSKKNKMAYVPTLLLDDGLLTMIEDGGKADCFDAATGASIWTAKLEGQFSSSPVLAAGRIYVVNEEGMAFVLKAGRHFDVIAKNDLGDGGFATPIICAGRIYLRTLHHLYCLGRP